MALHGERSLGMRLGLWEWDWDDGNGNETGSYAHKL